MSLTDEFGGQLFPESSDELGIKYDVFDLILPAFWPV
jgi:hypothetical protein